MNTENTEINENTAEYTTEAPYLLNIHFATHEMKI